MQIARKISIGSINGVSKGFKGIEGSVHVARIFGRATGFDIKTSESMGVSYGFKGEFIGVNRDGEETTAPVCYLMDPADKMLVAALEAANGGAVEFGFDFFAVEKESAVLGYEYKIKPLLEVKKSEPLLTLAAQFDASTAPKKAQLALASSDPVAHQQAQTDDAAEKAATETAEVKPTGKKK